MGLRRQGCVRGLQERLRKESPLMTMDPREKGGERK
jgi:hypothetical protein